MDQATKFGISPEDVEALAARTGLPLNQPGSLFIADDPVAGPSLSKPRPHLSGDMAELEDAIDAGDLDATRAILAGKPELNAHYGPFQGFPLLWAMTAEGRSHRMVAMLLDHGADPNFATPDGFSPLHYIGGYLFEEDAEDLRALTETLTRNGADIEARTQSGLTPLLRAVCDGRLSEVACLLDHGADPDASVAEGGKTPLIEAMYKPDILELLLDVGADPARQTSTGEDALALIQAELAGMPKGPSRFRRSLGAVVPRDREALELSLELLVQA